MSGVRDRAGSSQASWVGRRRAASSRPVLGESWRIRPLVRRDRRGHEGGHAAACWAIGIQLKYVTIVGYGTTRRETRGGA
jgi:hypothetical protein